MMSATERELLLFLGATMAQELDITAGSEISAEVRRLLDRVAAEERAAYCGEQQPNANRFMAAVEAFVKDWGSLVPSNREAAAVLREMRIVLTRHKEWGAAIT